MGEVQRTGGTPGQTGDQIDDSSPPTRPTIETSIGGDFRLGQPGLPQGGIFFDRGLQSLCRILRTPAFAQEKLDLAKVSKTPPSPARMTMLAHHGSEITRLVYGTNSPLRANTEYATIAAVTREDLSPWHKKVLPAE